MQHLQLMPMHDSLANPELVWILDLLSISGKLTSSVIVTAGPGVTNTITALQNAKMAESPVILLGGATSTLLMGRGSLQDIDHIALLKVW